MSVQCTKSGIVTYDFVTYIIHGTFLSSFKHWTVQKLGWLGTQVMPDHKPAIGNSTVHSVSVVVMVSERQGGNNFSLN